MLNHVVSFIRNGESVASVGEKLPMSRAERLASGLNRIARDARSADEHKASIARKSLEEIGVDFDVVIVRS